MRICLLCATRRGLSFLKTLKTISPEYDICVFSFRETPWEPPYFDDIKNYSHSIGAEFREARSVTAAEHKDFWEKKHIDVMFCVSWRYLIPSSIYRRCAIGAYIFHDSLLPKYRGFSPSVWALMNGEKEAGVTLFEIAPTVDSGKIVDQKSIPIARNDTISDLVGHVTETYLQILRDNFGAIVNGKAKAYEQDESQATYCCKLTPDDVRIDWLCDSEQIYNMIRAYGAPYPGAYCYYGDKKIHILQAQKIEHPKQYCGRIPGRIVEIDRDKRVTVLTGDGEISLQTVRTAKGEEKKAAEILSSFSQKLS